MKTLSSQNILRKARDQRGSTTSILLTILAVIVVLVIAYVGYTNRSNSGNSLAGVSYEVSTDKTEYTQNEPIIVTISINNKTNEEKTFNFNTGCQGSYEVAGFDLSKHVECIQSPSSFTVAPQTSQDIKVTHYPSLEKLPVGTHELTGKVIGYGEAKTTITIK